MNALAVSLILLGYILTMAASTSTSIAQDPNDKRDYPLIHQLPPQLHYSPIEKRASERYGFGLGRRAFSYTSGGNSGVKRLPVYNFGLGKRSGDTGYGGEDRRPYSFGLGKRTVGGSDSDEGSLEDARSVSYDSWPLYASREVQKLAQQQYNREDEKRARPYSFGLGKRDMLTNDEGSVERRGAPQRYNFGLGKRSN